MKRNLTRLLEREADELARELEKLSSEDAEPDEPWPSEPGQRGPTPLETNLGRKLAIFGQLSRHQYQKSSIYLRAMALSGTLGTERVIAMLKEIEGVQQQAALEDDAQRALEKGEEH